MASSSYVTMDLFTECVPLFQDGLRARDTLSSDDGSLTRVEKLELRRAVRKGEDAWAKVIEHVEWIINRAVRDEVNRPRAFHYIPDAEELRQAALEGVYKMMCSADLSKMHSPVNYIMQWIGTYVSRAATRDETQFGMPASRLQLYRKIAAIRGKMRKQSGCEPTDEEVYEYIKSGKAQVHTMNGRKNSNQSPRVREIPLKDIREQREFENGYPMKFAVDDPIQIDTEVQVSMDTNDIMPSMAQRFWMAWFESLHIDPSQWDDIAVSLDLYPVAPNEGTGKRVRMSPRLKQEMEILISSKTGGITDFARQWHDDNGSGPWDVFLHVTLLDEVPLNSVDSSGRKVFRSLRFIVSGTQ